MDHINFWHTPAQEQFIQDVLAGMPRPLVLAEQEGTLFQTRVVVEQLLVRGIIPEMRALLRGQNGDGFALVIGNPLGAVFLVYLEGDFTKWSYNYLRIALSKFEMAYRYRGNTSNFPAHLILPGDTVYSGGVYWKGIPIAVSGFKDYEDEDFGKVIGSAIETETTNYKVLWQSHNPEADFYT